MKDRIFIGLGTNLGDKFANLQAALDALGEFVEIAKISSIYQTAPWGYAEQDDFYNIVIEVNTDLAPLDLLDRLKTLESDLGRTESFRYGPRIIDMDILMYADLIYISERLGIPHPRMAERAFVLAPFAEIAPEVIHPILKKTIKQLLSEVDSSGVKKLT
ncbi:MAG TPA: 2-amino-4-hydroxy-6-hydroxymethyldihydropteridine diphosphokinase [Anaerolineales bacterium]|nr:2-amino-4-hydroxy-6-hydroxymethyldihydropteridine diphosphokinase [Anaerolineales bacterium]